MSEAGQIVNHEEHRVSVGLGFRRAFADDLPDFLDQRQLVPGASGAEIQVRPAGEKKVRWRQISDRSGEFAVRVPPGGEYELTVKAQGFEEQSRKIDARTGNREDLIIRMKPLPEGKKKK